MGGGVVATGLFSLPNIIVYILADPSEISVYFIIGYSEDTKSVFFKNSCSGGVLCHGLVLKMLTAVKLNDELGLGTVKIRYMVSQYLLTVETGGYTFAENRTKDAVLPWSCFCAVPLRGG